MKQLISFIAAIVVVGQLQAQPNDLRGMLTEPDGKPIAGAAVSLLYPADSTLAYFGVSNTGGRFEIRSAAAGSYVLQVAGMGYRTHYAAVQLPLASGNDLGTIRLQAVSQQLKEVEVKSERIPLLLKGDTVEYSAGAFKTKPDAVVEDLLKKLPGVEVDGAGNIKAMGKDVHKVLVDGKEFFGDDPKMATRNLPADAVNKVQVFDKKSDQSLFTGIDDGERNQTLNLQLKDDRRKGIFGDAEAGGGTDERYKLGAHLYKFNQKQQLAVLGMMNNINRFGFTLQDYLAFKGGMRGLADGGGGVRLALNDNLPVDFGQPVTGLITSGAGGINYSAEPRKGNRFTVSYLGNGATKQLTEQTLTRNFTDKGAFTRDDEVHEHSTNSAHRMNVSWRNDLDSSKQILLNGGVERTGTSTRRELSSASRMEGLVENSLRSEVEDEGTGLSGNLNVSYLKRSKGAWPVWKLSAGGAIEQSSTTTQWDNSTDFPVAGITVIDRQYQDNDSRRLSYDAGTSIVRRLAGGYYLEPGIRAGSDVDAINRRQGLLPAGEQAIDSLSPDFSRVYQWGRPGLSFRHNTEKIQYNLSIDGELGVLRSGLAGKPEEERHYSYLLPSAFWQYAYRQGSQVNLYYRTSVEAPSAARMLPVTDYTNPVQRTAGNPGLSPEYRHEFRAGWLRFDQFSFTSLMASIGGTYTHNKIGWSRTVAPDLSQDITFINVPDDYRVNARLEYNMPLRKLGISLSVALAEQFTQSISLIDGTPNDNTGYRHSLRLSGSNRKKDKWDLSAGGSIDITTARFSVQSSMNTQLYHYSGFGEIGYRPSAHFYLSLSATIDQYVSASLGGTVTVPLVNATAAYYFLPAKRGVLSLDAFDLLNRNTGLQRLSEGNYLVERRSDIIRQYFLLSFKYRLSRAPKGNGGVQIELRR